MMKEILFATNNKNKLEEVRNMLKGIYHVKSLEEAGCFDEIPETGQTLRENAHQKAIYLKDKYGLDCFADDTGLLINALNGEPGVYSARYAGDERDSEKNMNLVLKKLQNKEDRSAQFATEICLIRQGETHYFTGIAKGQIRNEKSGEKGFGYDPIFEPEGENRTFAELSQEEKNAISHRGKAVRALIEFLKADFNIVD